jgi:two-component system, sensor histidine kinase and response regulator
MDTDGTEKALNLDVALAHVDGDPELLSELAVMFIQDYPRLIEEAGDSILHDNPSGLERAAHTLKGRLAFFGIRKLHTRILDLEIMGRDGDLSRARPALDAIEIDMKFILAEFESLIRELNG